MEALEVEAELPDDKVRQLDVWLEDEITRSLWLCDVSLRMREISVIIKITALRKGIRIHWRRMKSPWRVETGNF